MMDGYRRAMHNNRRTIGAVILILSIFFVVSGMEQAEATAGLVQEANISANYGACTASMVKAYTTNVSANNMLIVAISLQTQVGFTALTVNDSQGNSFTRQVVQQTEFISTYQTYAAIWTAKAGSSAADTVTVGFSDTSAGSCGWSASVFELNGYSINSTAINFVSSTLTYATNNAYYYGAGYVAIGSVATACTQTSYTAGTHYTGIGTANIGMQEYSTSSLTSPTTFPMTASGLACNFYEVGAVFTQNSISTTTTTATTTSTTTINSTTTVTDTTYTGQATVTAVTGPSTTTITSTAASTTITQANSTATTTQDVVTSGPVLATGIIAAVLICFVLVAVLVAKRR